MKYLFIIQGEGRGHLTQALALSDMLRRNGHEVNDVLVGRCKGREIPKFFVDKINAPIVQFDSPSFEYGKAGKKGSILPSLMRNLRVKSINKWQRSLRMIADYISNSDADVVISFYEFLLCFANIWRPIRKPVIVMGHQFMVDHPDFEQPLSLLNRTHMLRFNNAICSYGVERRLALSFYPLVSKRSREPIVVPPLLRPEIFDLEVSEGDYILGYMLNPGYLADVEEWKRRNPEAKIHLFWDKAGAKECEERMPGLWLHKINDELFLKYMAGCRGYITTAGFESVCEAMYLGKPTLMIPVHIEQEINAYDATRVGAGEVSSKYDISKLERAIKNYTVDTQKFREWVEKGESIMLKELTNL